MELIQQEQKDEEILQTFTTNCHIFLLQYIPSANVWLAKKNVISMYKERSATIPCI